MNFDLTPDQVALQERVREFAQAEVAPRAEQLDRDGVFPTDLFKKLGELGVMSIPFPEEYGGMGLGVFDAVLAIEEVARADQSLAVSAMVSMATGLTVARFGTEEQKRTWLPDIVAGRKICSIAGTEPDAGSDTAGFKTRATPLGNGLWSLSGEKAYITNPGTDISSFAIILAVSSPRDAHDKKYTLFLVPHGTKGYTQGEKYRKMGWRSSDTRPLYLDDCVLPETNIVGNVNGGRWVLHKGYQAARLFLAACSLGLAQASFDHAAEIRQGAPGLRRLARPPPDDPGDDRQDGAEGRQRPPRHLPRRLGRRCRQGRHDGAVHGQAARHRDGFGGRQHGDPDPRRLGLHG